MQSIVLKSDADSLYHEIIEIDQKNGLIVFMGAGNASIFAKNFADRCTHTIF